MEGAEPDGEGPDRRRVRTFLIADIRGYSTFTRERGDDDAARLATRFADLARDSVEARSGRVIELRGDEALAVFDSAPQAVRAAIEFQQACREATTNDPDLPLPVGVGIDTGEAVAVEDGYRGRALNMAARLCSRAAGGQVLITREASAAIDVEAGIALVPRGTAELKGFDGPVELVEAMVPEPRGEFGGAPSAEPVPIHDTPLVGREHELRWLRGTWRQARRGNGRTMFVSGPAGIGKTRLVAELAGWVTSEGGTVAAAAAGGAEAARALAVVAEARTTERPTLCVVEDLALHESVVDGMAELADDVAERPVLVVGLFRSADGNPALADLVARTDVRGDGLRVLGPLDLAQVREVVRRYAGDSIDEAPVEAMLRSSGGVPARVHEAASAWARDTAGRRLAAAAEWLARGRSRQSADLAFAGNVIELGLHRIYGTARRADRPDECPYQGLASFTEADADLFFGRERLIGELAARSVSSGLLAIVGPSGSGKSSVMMAGLLPSLAAELLPGSDRWRPVRMRPGEHPLRLLEEAAATTKDDGRLLVAIDQFEELFTTTDEDERTRFVDRLVELAGNPDRVIVVLTLRADHVGHCAPYRELADLLAANMVLVGPMTDDELRRAIELPANHHGVRIESSLVDTLVAEVRDEPGGLPLLSTALVELWQARADGWLRLEAYDRTGGVRGAVARLAEESFARLDGPEREAARAVLLRLATGAGETLARRRVPIAEFEPDLDPLRAAVLARFTADRLITVSDDTVEVAHEALLREWPRLRAWLDEDAEGRVLRHRITEASSQWVRSDRDPSELFRGARLATALDWSALHGRELNATEREFLAASRTAAESEAQRQRRTNRRLRGLLVGVAVLLVLALVAGSLALVQRSHARRAATAAQRNATDALSQSLGAQALNQKDLPLSLLLAHEGVDVRDSIQTRGYLLSALERSPYAVRVYRPLPGRYPTFGVYASPDGNEFLVGPTDGAEWGLVETSTGKVLRRGSSKLPALSADGTRIGVLDQLHVSVLDARTGKTLTTVPLSARLENNFEFGSQWSPDLGTVVLRINPIAGSVAPSNVYVVDARTGAVQTLPPSPRGTPAYSEMQFSPDGRFLVGVSVSPSADVATVWRAGQYSRPLATVVRQAVGGGSAAVAMSHDDRLVAMGGDDGSVTVFDLHHPASRGRVFTGRHAAAVNGLAFTPDDRTLVSIGGDQQVLVWDVTAGSLQQTLDGHSGTVNGLAIAADGATIFTDGADGSVIEWNVAGKGTLARRRIVGDGAQGYSQTFVVSSANERVAASPQDTISPKPYVALIGGRTPAPIKRIPIGAVAVALNPDGTRLAVATHQLDSSEASIGPRITLWDTSTAHLIGDLSGPPKFVTIDGQQYGNDIEALAFSHDGRIVAGIDDHAVVYLWGVASRRLVSTISATATPDAPHSGVGIAFGPDGTVLAGAYDGGVRAWRLPGGRPLYTLPVEAKPLAFSPDGRLLAVGGNDGTVSFFDAATGVRRGSPVPASAGPLQTVEFSRDGRVLLAAGAGTAALVDVASRRQVGQLSGQGVTGGAMFWNRDSTVDLVDDIGTMFSWRITTGSLSEQACSVAGRNLTRFEWHEFLGARPYRATCPSYPSP